MSSSAIAFWFCLRPPRGRPWPTAPAAYRPARWACRSAASGLPLLRVGLAVLRVGLAVLRVAACRLGSRAYRPARWACHPAIPAYRLGRPACPPHPSRSVCRPDSRPCPIPCCACVRRLGFACARVRFCPVVGPIGLRPGSFLKAFRGVRQPLLGGAEVLLADALDARLHVLHLLLGVGVGDLEVLEVVEEPADLLVEAVGAVVDPAADLALDHLGVLEVVAAPAGRAGRSSTACAGRPRRACLACFLHGEDARGLLADLAALVVELAGDVLVGEDAQAELAALAQVRPLEVVEVAGVGVEGDDRAGRELQRGEVPVVGAPPGA